MSHDEHNPAMGHGFEPGSAEKGLQYRLIYFALMAIIALCVFFSMALWPMVKGMSYMEARDSDTPLLDAQLETLRPAGALLQPDPPADLERLEKRDDHQLNSYGWVDQASGRAHIPLEIARQKVLDEGLPQAAYAFQSLPESSIHSETYPEGVSTEPPAFTAGTQNAAEEEHTGGH